MCNGAGLLSRCWARELGNQERRVLGERLEVPALVAVLDREAGFLGGGEEVVEAPAAARAEADEEAAAGAQELLAYKARPLNGIWATAPYLHNGSVPTLYDLLLPARLRNTVPAGVPVPDPAGPLRPERFTLGTRAFDPVKVGFAEGAPDSTLTFNVRDAAGAPIPGNSNAGHDYGNASLSDEDRLNLLEYLKSL